MKELSPRERFTRAIRREPVDRVPVMYRMKAEAKAKLARIYGIDDAGTGRKHNPELELRLGNDAIPGARMAEIYTFPSGMTALTGDIVLNVEAEVTARNCGRSVAAQSIQIGPLTAPAIMDLTMAMPDCDAIGEYLVLKNMFEDLTLAAK